MRSNTDTYRREALSIAHFPDRSTRWLFQYRENVEGLIAILAPYLAGSIDFDRLTPVNRTFISEELREQESDIVYQVPFQGASGTEDLLIYILIEHQSTVDPTMGFRMLSYMMQLWLEQGQGWETEKLSLGERRLSLILPIVFYTGRQQWSAPLSVADLMDIPESLSRFVPTFDTLFLSVRETPAEELTATDHAFGWLLRVLQQEYADIALLREALIAAVSRLNALEDARAGERYRALAYLLHFILHRREAAEHNDLITVVKDHSSKTEVEPMAESMAEVLIERGAKETTIENIVLCLDTRFQANTAQTLKPALAAIDDLPRLKHLLQAAIQTQSLEAFMTALKTNGAANS